jgi:hypothetical protein
MIRAPHNFGIRPLTKHLACCARGPNQCPNLMLNQSGEGDEPVLQQISDLVVALAPDRQTTTLTPSTTREGVPPQTGADRSIHLHTRISEGFCARGSWAGWIIETTAVFFLNMRYLAVRRRYFDQVCSKPLAISLGVPEVTGPCP